MDKLGVTGAAAAGAAELAALIEFARTEGFGAPATTGTAGFTGATGAKVLVDPEFPNAPVSGIVGVNVAIVLL